MLFKDKEIPHVYSVEQRQCMGIFHYSTGEIGVLLVVGGPQYRVGSHRQFVVMSRALAEAGIPSFRFDVRGMGDSTGTKQAFYDLDEDITEALNQFEKISGLKQFVILGLCDGASASMIYASKDKRIRGLVLINPWLKNTAAQGQVMLKHYYSERLFNGKFWKKLFSGRVSLVGTLSDFFTALKRAFSGKNSEALDYPSQMMEGMAAFRGKACLILSGKDLTAREFEQITKQSELWQRALSVNLETHNFSNADHTFSDPAEEKRLLDTITSFLKSIS